MFIKKLFVKKERFTKLMPVLSRPIAHSNAIWHTGGGRIGLRSGWTLLTGRWGDRSSDSTAQAVAYPSNLPFRHCTVCVPLL